MKQKSRFAFWGFSAAYFIVFAAFAPVGNGEFTRSGTNVTLLYSVLHLTAYLLPYLACLIASGGLYGIFNSVAFYLGLLVQSLIVGWVIARIRKCWTD